MYSNEYERNVYDKFIEIYTLWCCLLLVCLFRLLACLLAFRLTHLQNKWNKLKFIYIFHFPFSYFFFFSFNFIIFCHKVDYLTVLVTSQYDSWFSMKYKCDVDKFNSLWSLFVYALCLSWIWWWRFKSSWEIKQRLLVACLLGKCYEKIIKCRFI